VIVVELFLFVRPGCETYYFIRNEQQRSSWFGWHADKSWLYKFIL